MREETQETTLSPFWLAIYLLAVAFVAVAAGVLFFRHDMGGVGQLGRLLPMLLVGEILGYLVVLIAPGERVVPPQRALMGVGFAMVARLLLAFFTASALRLGDPSAGTGALLGQVYASRWAIALLHVLLMVLYLWLVRGVLEIDRLKAPVEKPPSRRVAATERAVAVDRAEERRQKLLSALIDPDEAAEEPTPTTPRVTEASSLSPELVAPPFPAQIGLPDHETTFAEVLAELGEGQIIERLTKEPQADAEIAVEAAPAPEEPLAAPEAAAPPPALEFTPGWPPAETVTAERIPATEETPVPEAEAAPPAPLTLPLLEDHETSEETAAFVAVEEAPEAAPTLAEAEAGSPLAPVVEALAEDAPEVKEADATELEAAVPARDADSLRELLRATAPEYPIAVGVAAGTLLGAIAASEEIAAGTVPDLAAVVPLVAAALATLRAGDLESLLALGAGGAAGLTSPTSGLDHAAVVALMPGEVQLGSVSLQLKQLRRQLDTLDLPAGEIPPVEQGLVIAAPADLPSQAEAAQAALGTLVALQGRRTLLVAPENADPMQLGALAERLYDEWSNLTARAGLGPLQRVLLTGTSGGLVVGVLGEGLLVALAAASGSEVAKRQVQLRKLQDANTGSEA